MAALRSGQEKYLEAAEWYEKALPHCPMFARTLLVKAGEMYMAANDLDKASASCLKALEMDPGFDFALNTLHDITDQLRNKGYDENTGMDAALGVLQKIRAIKGEAYEASFHNNAGNVYFYFSDYAQSAEHYRLAIESGGNDAVYYDNLAGALEKMSDYQYSLAHLEAALPAAEKAAELNPANDNYRQKTTRIAHKIKTLRHFGVVAEERSASIVPVRVRFRNELQEWLVKGSNLDPDLLHKIEAMREQFRKTYGFTIPGVRFSADWNITPDANIVIDLDGIPAQQGWLNFEKGKEQEPVDTLVGWLEQLIHLNLADFIHYDSPEISAKFAGKSAFHAASFFQVVRVLLKQKIPIGNIDTIHELFEAERAKNPKITIQELAQSIRCHPSILPGLPVNAAVGRDLIHLRSDQEEHILTEAGKSHCGEQFMQIRQSDPVFQEIIGDYWPKMDYYPGGHAEFVVSRSPKVATLLNDLRPGYYFSQSEILNLTETEKSAMPT
jgi:tetratricopeptide (TPR) repeat protein